MSTQQDTYAAVKAAAVRRLQTDGILVGAASEEGDIERKTGDPTKVLAESATPPPAAMAGLPEMTPAALKAAALKHDGYETPELNNKLYLHFQGFRRIENLEPYIGLKALWLESNGLTELRGLNHLKQLRSLFLQNNLIENIGDALVGLDELAMLDISSNRLSSLEGLSSLPKLSTLIASKNSIASTDALLPLCSMPALRSLDVSDNLLEDSEAMLELLPSLPITCLYLKGNACVRKIRHYRRTVLTTLPQLTFLDDAPVFAEEQRTVKAWASGGRDAEKKERAVIREETQTAARARTVRFFQWQAQVRDRRAMELEDLKAQARRRGEDDSGITLPRTTWVRYSKVTPDAQAASARLKRSIMNAEAAAQKYMGGKGRLGDVVSDEDLAAFLSSTYEKPVSENDPTTAAVRVTDPSPSTMGVPPPLEEDDGSTVAMPASSSTTSSGAGAGAGAGASAGVPAVSVDPPAPPSSTTKPATSDDTVTPVRLPAVAPPVVPTTKPTESAAAPAPATNVEALD